MDTPLDRRRFLKGAAAGLAAAGSGLWLPPTLPARALAPQADGAPEASRRDYGGPNVVLIRFGGGVRRPETIDLEHTYAPWFRKVLVPRGTLYTRMEISQLDDIETSHGQGTLYILTGKYDRYTDIENQFLADRFEPKVPTIFEQLRKTYAIAEHEALIINGEDRTSEEFYSFSNHHLFGVQFKSEVLSLYRYKVYLLEEQLRRGDIPEKEIAAKRKALDKLKNIDPRARTAKRSAKIEEFWRDWRKLYGDSGLKSARGDALLTDLAVRALKSLRPRLLMVNYMDPDYVHWGNPSHYTRGIAAIDRGIRQLVDTVEADEHYRDNTVFVVVPDCGRDTNRLVRVPYQHHFGGRSAHEIFAFVMGPGIARNQIVDRVVDQTCIAPTVGRIMDFETTLSEGSVLEEVFP